jgi:serine/threonine protein kinase
VTDADARLVGRYRLERILASGATGVVWEGWDEHLQRRVAVKQIAVQPWLDQSQRAGLVARVSREAWAAARVLHPNVVEIFDVVEAGGHPCLIMEYVPSQSLYEAVTQRGALDPATVARVGAQAAAGLAAAHRAGIVHGDVRPSNVLVRADGVAKVTDFGLGRTLGDFVPAPAGTSPARPVYLAPERAQRAPAERAGDVYSLGATLAMALAGRPWTSSERTPAADGGPLAALLAAMLAPDPAQRPAMIDVAISLPALQPGLPDSPVHEPGVNPPPAGDAPAGSVEPEPEPEPDRQRRRVWAPVVAALLAISLGVALGLMLLTGTGGGDEPVGAAPGPPSVPAPTRTASPTPLRPPATSRATGTPDRPQPPPQPRHRPTPSAAQLENAVVTYFRLVPGDLDAGWSRLTPHFQRTKAQSRRAYDSFWGSVRRVAVHAARGLPPRVATATLTYYYKDGRVVTQRTRFTFAHDDGLFKIDSESYPS